ncbi:MAG TPA: hypothetical protein VHB68_04005, partial [Steroidobacteraceae bacterium]|nr:hypothetical protein [Steroidobacteraceae bacterium]
MGLLKFPAGALLAAALAWGSSAGAATPPDWEIDLDARLVNVDGPLPLIDGGLGALRYGGDESGLRLGRARFALSQPLGQVWAVHLDASSWGNRDKVPVGLTEAYLLFRPYPFAGYRLRIRTGAFYAPISLENRASGWESPYTLSYSAINSWIGEEVRTIGTEAQLDWLGTHTGHDFDVGLTTGLFGWNDNAGAALADGGFTLTDRQTVLWGRVGKPGVPPVRASEPFHEMDANAGAYGGLELRYLDRVVLRFLRYDNNATPGPPDPITHMAAWNTQFDSAGLRIEAGRGWTVIAQWLSGATYISPAGTDLRWPFRASFALLSKRLGRHTFSVRYDRFEVGGYSGGDEEDDDGQQNGHAL